MRPAEYKDEQIVAAGEKLLAEGRGVTAFALRREIGGGNPNRLIAVWQDHQNRQAVVDSEPVQELPVEIEDRLQEMTQGFLDQVRQMALQLNHTANRTAERRVAEVLRTAQAQEQRAEAEMADAAETVEDLEATIESLQAKLTEMVEARERDSEARQHLLDKLNTLNTEFAVQEEKLGVERKLREVAEERLSTMGKQLNGLKEESAEKQARIRALEAECAKVAEEREELIEARSEVKALAGEKSELIKRMAALESAHAEVKSQLREDRQALAEAQQAGEEARSQIVVYRTQAEQANAQVEKLMARLSPTESTKEKKR